MREWPQNRGFVGLAGGRLLPKGMLRVFFRGWCWRQNKPGRAGQGQRRATGFGRHGMGAGLAVILAVLAGNPGFAGEFIVISDLHDTGASQDPPPLFQPGRDADVNLIESALWNARTNCAGQPRFVLCLGDILAHNKQRPPNFSATNVSGQVAGMFNSVFPGVPVFTVPGNNDTDTADGSPGDSDYLPQPPAFLASFARSWSALIRDPQDKTNFLDTFAAHGWYSVNLPGLAKVRLVGLDTAYFENTNLLPHGVSDIAGIESGQQCLASNQVVWLGQQLSQAQSEGVTLWLAFHIPPGRDPYPNAVPFWDSPWNTAVLRLIAAHRETIGAIFCGHTHADEFRVIYAGRQPVAFVHIAPSISPIHGNYPAYQIFEIDPQTDRLLDYRTYRLTSQTGGWSREYSFTNQYSAPDYGLASLIRLEESLHTNEADWQVFSNCYTAGARGGGGAVANRRVYLRDLRVPVDP